MIGEVQSLVTPTQYVVLRVTSAGWGDGAKLQVRGTDSRNGREFAEVIKRAAPCDSLVLRVGPFTRGSTASVTVELLGADNQALDAWSSAIEITNPNSPAVIVRQAVYDILEAAGLSGVILLTDGLRRPACVAEDTPFTAGPVVVEVGAPASRKRKVSHVRSEVTCEIPITIYIFGYSTGEAFTLADNTAWAIQAAVDARPNLSLSGLGVNDFTWSWDVQQPEVLDVQGSTMPVVLQDVTLTVPVIWTSCTTA